MSDAAVIAKGFSAVNLHGEGLETEPLSVTFKSHLLKLLR